MIHDLRNHNRTHAWTGVGSAKRHRHLCDELLLADAVEVTPETHAFFRRTEAEPVGIPGEIGLRVARKEPCFLTLRAEGKPGPAGVKIGLRENHESPGRNQGRGWNLEFFWRTRIVTDEPAADVDGIYGRVEQLDG